MGLKGQFSKRATGIFQACEVNVWSVTGQLVRFWQLVSFLFGNPQNHLRPQSLHAKIRTGKNTDSFGDTLDFLNCLISHGFTGGLIAFAMISEHTMKLKPAQLHETREKTVQRTGYGLDRVAVLGVAERWLWFTAKGNPTNSTIQQVGRCNANLF